MKTRGKNGSSKFFNNFIKVIFKYGQKLYKEEWIN